MHRIIIEAHGIGAGYEPHRRQPRRCDPTVPSIEAIPPVRAVRCQPGRHPRHPCARHPCADRRYGQEPYGDLLYGTFSPIVTIVPVRPLMEDHNPNVHATC